MKNAGMSVLTLVIFAACYYSDGSPAWWSKVRKWFTEDPCDLPCPVHSMAACYYSDGSPAWWSKVRKWFTKDPCDLPCPVHYDLVCAVRNTNNGSEYVLADNECVLENYNKCFGTNYTVVCRGMCKPINKYIRQPQPPHHSSPVSWG